MLETIDLTRAAQYIGAGMAIGFGAIGAAIGEGYAAGLNGDRAVAAGQLDVVRGLDFDGFGGI